MYIIKKYSKQKSFLDVIRSAPEQYNLTDQVKRRAKQNVARMTRHPMREH